MKYGRPTSPDKTCHHSPHQMTPRSRPSRLLPLGCLWFCVKAALNFVTMQNLVPCAHSILGSMEVCRKEVPVLYKYRVVYVEKQDLHTQHPQNNSSGV